MVNDLDRLRTEYADREKRLAGSDLYSLTNPACLFMFQQRQRAVLRLLQAEGFGDLSRRTVLELGCGTGRVLNEYMAFGAAPETLHGVDLLPHRLKEAKRLLPHVDLVCADGQRLPYADASFDIVLQYTAFSSILDDSIKANLASEMLRILCSDGLILWYDFWLNPTNPHTKGIRSSEIRMLFPDSRLRFQRITLAPPITRRIAPWSWLTCHILESLKIFNTHYLVSIRKDRLDHTKI
ncbi:class I SAM-dependent methyltransferase [Methylobacterium nigriterrae]|uniref:class I SAM-dependent methyltransferase n=1 Tax=Methylobacterium nigriterrae TaxID=3127512 RepID=UPI003013C78D